MNRSNVLRPKASMETVQVQPGEYYFGHCAYNYGVPAASDWVAKPYKED